MNKEYVRPGIRVKYVEIRHVMLTGSPERTMSISDEVTSSMDSKACGDNPSDAEGADW